MTTFFKDTEDPDSGEHPRLKKPVVKSDNDEFPTWMVVLGLLAVIAVVGLIAILAANIFFGGNDAPDEELRVRAESVLEARFKDTSDDVGPLQELTVRYEGDILVVDWVQGETVQKECTAPVLVSEDGQSFGIAPFEAVPLDQLGTAEAHCVTTSGLVYGLPMSEE
jgi:hypothetical protein